MTVVPPPGGPEGDTAVASARGRTALIARWPVASMRGEILDEGHFDAHGLVGDRLFGAWLDDDADEPARADRYPVLLDWAARYPTAADTIARREELPDVDVTGPDGAVHAWSSRQLAKELAEALGRKVTLRRRDRGFVYFPDSVHITFQASLEALSEAIGHPDLSVLRFRPNLHLDCDAPAFAEDGWANRLLTFAGGAVLRTRQACDRCVIPTRNSSDPKDRDKRMLPWLIRNRGMNFGIIADVVVPGPIRTGEAFTVAPAGDDSEFPRTGGENEQETNR